MTTNLKVSEISLNEIPANAIVITYSNHYKHNSGDDIYLTDANGNEGGNEFLKNGFMHEKYEDRGIIAIKAITHENGAFAALKEFKTICLVYVDASNDLKKWENGEPVYNVQTDDATTLKYGNCGTWKQGTKQSQLFSGSKDMVKFENSRWFRFCAKRSKTETIEKKRIQYYQEQSDRNSAIHQLLINRKAKAAKWFIENEISVRNAYLFLQGYYS